MRGSFRRLVVSSVLICWALGLLAVMAYLKSRTWTDTQIRADGVYLAYELLEATDPDERQARMEELRPEFWIPMELENRANVEQLLGESLGRGEHARRHGSFGDEWYYIAFEDSDSVLAVGPVNPRRSNRHIPIGLIMGFLLIPAIAGFLAIQIERGLSRVEDAAEAISVGELSARVPTQEGPSRELAIRFNEMAERVERLVRGRDELIQAVSHELGSPLTRLRFHLELLEGHPDEKRIEAMKGELDALDALVSELVGYVQSEDADMNRETFAPAQGLADLVELASLEIGDDRAVRIHLEVDADLEVNADARGFLRAIENLIRNAARYAETEVRVAAAHRDGGVVVSVEDDGPGIPEEMREAVRTPFVRLEADRGRSTGGVGLGLAIVDRIVTRHAGKLEIGERSGGGALVVTRWPG